MACPRRMAVVPFSPLDGLSWSDGLGLRNPCRSPAKPAPGLSGPAGWDMDYVTLSATEMDHNLLQHSDGKPRTYFAVASYWTDTFPYAFSIKGLW